MSTTTRASSISAASTYRSRWLLSFAVIALCVGNLSVTGPAAVYVANPHTFAYPLLAVLGPMVVLAVVATASVATVLAYMPPRWFRILLACLLAVGVSTWIQGTFLLWGYRVLQGGDLNWTQGDHYGWADPLIWLAVLAAALVFQRWLTRNGLWIACGLLFVQFAAIGLECCNSPTIPPHQRYAFDTKHPFEFSPRNNIIVLVLDSFQSSAFAEALELRPALKRCFADFVFYQNTTAVFSTTIGSIPTILTGQPNLNESPLVEYIPRAYAHSLPGELKKAGWRIDLYPWAWQTVLCSPAIADNTIQRAKSWVISSQTLFLLDLSIFRQVPHILKRSVFNDNKWLFSGGVSSIANQGDSSINLLQFERQISNASVSPQDQRPRFSYYHLQGPHVPFWLNADLKPERLPRDSYGYKQQATGCLQLVGKLLSRLKELSIYDDALIVVAGDHGCGVFNASTSCEPVSADTPSDAILGNGTPLLLVKFPGRLGVLATSQKPVTLADIPATIGRAQAIAYTFPGCPIQDLEESESRERYFYFYGFEGWDQLYLPPLQEWRITGHSWSANAWRKTGRILAPKGQLVEDRLVQSDEATVKFGKGSASNDMLKEGWAEPEDGFVWSNSNRCSLNLPYKTGASSLLMKFELHPCKAFNGITCQRVGIRINGRKVAEWEIEELGTYQVWVPADQLPNGIIKVTFDIPDLTTSHPSTAIGTPHRTGIALHGIRLIKAKIGNEKSRMDLSKRTILGVSRQQSCIIQVRTAFANAASPATLPPIELLVDGVTCSVISGSSESESAELLLPADSARSYSMVEVRRLFPSQSASGDESTEVQICVVAPGKLVPGETIEMGTVSSSNYCLTGWANPEKGIEQTGGKPFRWTESRRAVFAFSFSDKASIRNSTRNIRLSICAEPLFADQVKQQRVCVSVNGHNVGQLAISAYGTYHLDFPSSMLVDNAAIISLDLPDAKSPAFDLLVNEDTRRLGLRTEAITLAGTP